MIGEFLKHEDHKNVQRDKTKNYVNRDNIFFQLSDIKDRSVMTNDKFSS